MEHVREPRPPPPADAAAIRVAVVGAGAMGGYFAALIAESGGSVALVDVDARRVAAIAAHGLRVEDDRGDRTVPLDARLAEDVEAPVDLVVVFTKGMHTLAAARSVRHVVGERTWFLTLQNGLGNAEEIAALYPRHGVALGVTDVPSDLVGPAHVRSHGEGSVRLWSSDGRQPEMVERIRSMLERAGIPCVADPDIGTAVWEKASFNAALNAVTALARVPVGGLDNPHGRALVGSIVGEAVAVATAAGVAVSERRILSRIDHALAHHVGHEPSMLQDVRAGRATEIETINGAIVRAGEAHGVPTPVNATVCGLVRLVQAARAGTT